MADKLSFEDLIPGARTLSTADIDFSDLVPSQAEVSAEDLLLPQPTGSPGYRAQQDSIRSRNGVLPGTPDPNTAPRLGDMLRGAFGGHNPVAETYDHFVQPAVDAAVRSTPRTEDEKKLEEFQQSRGPLERLAGLGNYIGSLPIRMATQGEYGAGDVLTAAGLPSAGAATSQSEADFVRANEPQLQALQKAGDLAAGTAGVSFARPLRPSPEIHHPKLPEPRATDAAADLAAFKDSDIRPFGPAFSSGPVAGLSKSLADTPFIGAPVRNALEESIAGAGRRADELASRFGNAATDEQAGRAVQEGIERYKDSRPDDVVRERLQSDASAARPSQDTSPRPQSVEDLPQQVLQVAYGTDGFTPVADFHPIERKMLSDVGIEPMRMSNGDMVYDTQSLIAEAKRRRAAGEIDNSIGQFDNSHIAKYEAARQSEATPIASDQYRHDIIAAPSRETSRKTKSEALYDEAWDRIPPEMQVGRSREGDSRFLGGLGNTANVLDKIIDRNLGVMNRSRASRDGAVEVTRSGDEVAPVGRQVAVRGGTIPEAALPVLGGQLGRILRDIASRQWRGTLQDMRELRSALRRLSSGMLDTEKNTLQNSDVERLRAAVSRDMQYTLERNAKTYLAKGQRGTATQILRAAQLFKRADDFYRLSQQRIDAIESLFGAKNPEAVYRNVVQAAQIKGGDMTKLRALAKILRGGERDEIASGILNQLGRPNPSARGFSQETGFSVNSWLTNWNKLSPEGKLVLFGERHMGALDKLARVARRLADVEAQVNSSRSGTHLTNMAGIASAGTSLVTGNWVYFLGSAGTGYAASLLLSRPSYVMWAAKYAALRARALAGPKAVIRPLHEQIHKLAMLSEADPRLIPVVISVAKDNGLDVDPNSDANQENR